MVVHHWTLVLSNVEFELVHRVPEYCSLQVSTRWEVVRRRRRRKTVNYVASEVLGTLMFTILIVNCE